MFLDSHKIIHFLTEASAVALADESNALEDDGWVYEAIELPRGWAVRVIDADCNFLGYL